MDLESTRQHCLSFPRATEQIQWDDDLVFKVGGKMFAVLALEPDANGFLSFKCTPENFAELTELPGIKPAPYLARYDWVALDHPEALEETRLQDLLRKSFEMVVAKLPKKVQRELSI